MIYYGLTDLREMDLADVPQSSVHEPRKLNPQALRKLPVVLTLWMVGAALMTYSLLVTGTTGLTALVAGLLLVLAMLAYMYPKLYWQAYVAVVSWGIHCVFGRFVGPPAQVSAGQLGIFEAGYCGSFLVYFTFGLWALYRRKVPDSEPRFRAWLKSNLGLRAEQS